MLALAWSVTMLQWRIYYDNGQVFDSTEGKPEDAPSHGILVITEKDQDHGRLCLNGWDWYYHDGECWWGADLHGLLDRLLHNLPTHAVKQGRMAPQKVWHDTLDRAVTDPDFPAKGAKHKRERPFQNVGW
jgi:hypothetical protein